MNFLFITLYNNRFEKVNSNDNNKLQLAKDESKRLQEKIKELLNENSDLQNDIDDLCKQKEDALTRYTYNEFFT